MNKLEGFYQLKSVALPTVDWKEYVGQPLDDGALWTVRSAVFSGGDLSLPRAVGVSAEKATAFAREQLKKMQGEGIVIVYPFFVAEKSGTVAVSSQKTEIECVLGDLWNLVTHGRADFSTVYLGDEAVKSSGDTGVLAPSELEYLMECAKKLRRFFREEMAEGKTVYAEWSFAFSCDKNGGRMGERYPVFYELRTV